ncbi:MULTISPECIES: hypothetical protein [Sphingobium]|uniref:hypothetical protein n=1 Tax=Sphingobium TaxID=165695 RepID=UPI0015EC73D0|nr:MULTISPECIES: hypothetical protein [Sphingobium]MCW2363163.1 hypothetical protein [Sphingobium sp. B10D3B]MCW2400157.1 hypothetical protein [Sphingobium sp. B10D7B]MCW2407135.1 hypothetical protein [Sphingobium xanthum]
MIRNSTEKLEDILTRFVDEVAAPTREATLAFADRFPTFKPEILRFSVIWAEQEVLPEAETLSPAMVADLSSKLGVQVREQLAHAGAPVMPRVRGLSLNSMCVAVGRSLHELADACGLDLMLARKLDDRRIEPSSIPMPLTRRIAAFIGVPEERVFQAWSRPLRQPKLAFSSPRRGAAVSYSREKFADAVANSTLSSEAQAALISLQG